MIKKLLPFVLMAFMSACAQTPVHDKACCEHCAAGTCAECCKGKECRCCKEGCTSCHGKTGTAAPEAPCPLCDEAEREWQAKHGGMKH